jgi:hypothetical protein
VQTNPFEKLAQSIVDYHNKEVLKLTQPFEQTASFYRNEVRSVNKLTKLPSDNAIVIETVEGSGKGSKFSLIRQEIVQVILTLHCMENLYFNLLLADHLMMLYEILQKKD